jgi:hypothetical protein
MLTFIVSRRTADYGSIALLQRNLWESTSHIDRQKTLEPASLDIAQQKDLNTTTICLDRDWIGADVDPPFLSATLACTPRQI